MGNNQRSKKTGGAGGDTGGSQSHDSELTAGGVYVDAPPAIGRRDGPGDTVIVAGCEVPQTRPGGDD